MIRLFAPLLLVLLASCGGGSPPPAPGSAEADAIACRDTAAKDVNQHNAKRALDWFASPVTRWGAISDATQRCMIAKNHPQLRWCRGDELVQAQRAGRVVVTSAGVQCWSAAKS